MPKKKVPELDFQKHIADFLVREHSYGMLERGDIADTTHFIAEGHLWSFLMATQGDTLKKLAENYGTDARDEVFKALHKELASSPLWMILRHGLKVRGLDLHLYYPKPRSFQSAATDKYTENRITFRPHFYFGETNEEIDFVFYLNGLPIVALELKHEKNQNVHDAVAQFVARDQSVKIFQHPFIYLAADTSDVMAATNPSRTENFKWHNTGLTNQPITKGEYPVEFLYREVLSKDRLLELLSFYLINVPKRDAQDDRPAQSQFTILPRYHQSRMVRKLANAAQEHFTASGNIGGKYLINHSAGSGKTLSICWLADRLHSLYKPDTNDKLTDIVFILTDRKALDKNIKDELENFTHLKDVIGLAKKAEDLPRFLAQRKPIIVSTLQKFVWILEEIENKPELKKLRVAFLIDEAHRSQEGQMGVAIRVPFRNPDEPDTDVAATEKDEEEAVAKIIREHDNNQLFVAFTATPAPSTVSLFGSPFDVYSEAEAIDEGYIVDVAASIISYKTLYNLHCSVVPDKDKERVFSKGIIAKALQNVAFQDDELIQYKAEVMLRIFENSVKPLIDGQAKALIVTTSRIAGLRYFNIIKEKLRERQADYKVLYAFSDFTHPQTSANITEHAINELKEGELIEDRFEGSDYRLMIVANKFQTGFDQPLLAGMFLDKPVKDRNAVQTVSRLNRCYEGKSDVVVVDFTNNAKGILKAFTKYRKGTPFEPEEPDKDLCPNLYAQIKAVGLFTQKDASDFQQLVSSDASDARIQYIIHGYKVRFQAMLSTHELRNDYVYLLAKYVKCFHFMTCFFTFPEELKVFASFADYVGPQLIKQGTVSELMKRIHQTEVIKASVEDQGIEKISGGARKPQSGRGRHGPAPVVKKITVQDMIDEIRVKFSISDEEALYIKRVTEEKVADKEIKSTVQIHQDDAIFLDGAYRMQVNGKIKQSYNEYDRYEELADPKYTDLGGIFDIMAVTVIQSNMGAAS